MTDKEWQLLATVIVGIWQAYNEWRIRSLQSKLQEKTVEANDAETKVAVHALSDDDLRAELAKRLGNSGSS